MLKQYKVEYTLIDDGTYGDNDDALKRLEEIAVPSDLDAGLAVESVSVREVRERCQMGDSDLYSQVLKEVANAILEVESEFGTSRNSTLILRALYHAKDVIGVLHDIANGRLDEFATALKTIESEKGNKRQAGEPKEHKDIPTEAELCRDSW